MKSAKKNSATGRPSAAASAEAVPTRRLHAALRPMSPDHGGGALDQLRLERRQGPWI